MSVTWEISCQDINMMQYVEADSHEHAVSELLSRGFERLLGDECPFQDEPLAMKDRLGRIWDAIPARFDRIERLRPGAEFMSACGDAK